MRKIRKEIEKKNIKKKVSTYNKYIIEYENFNGNLYEELALAKREIGIYENDEEKNRETRAIFIGSMIINSIISLMLKDFFGCLMITIYFIIILLMTYWLYRGKTYKKSLKIIDLSIKIEVLNQLMRKKEIINYNIETETDDVNWYL